VNKVAGVFDRWAANGMAEKMEAEHGGPVRQVLRRLDPGKPFSFLDVGCGNGWVVREVARMAHCKRAVGIDASKDMIRNARSKKESDKESYEISGIEGWGTQEVFDRIFSMETIYYTESPQRALDRIFDLLCPGGVFFCGMDFYAENKATAVWSERMNLRMHLLPKGAWVGLFERAGFEAEAALITDGADPKEWKRDLGTLFVTGTRPLR